MNLQEFISCIKGLGIKATKVQVQRLFNQIASLEEEEEDDDEDPAEQIVELLGDVSRHKAAIERLVPAAELRQLFVPKAAMLKRGQAGTARRTQSLSTPTGSRRSPRGDSSMRTVANLEDTRAEAALRLERLVADVSDLVSVVQNLGISESPNPGHASGDEHRDLQRMRWNFSFMLGTSLRQRLVEYSSEVEAMEGNGPGRRKFVADLSRAVKDLDKAAAKVKIDRPYGFPRFMPISPQGAQHKQLRSRCRNSILATLSSMSASAEPQLSSQMLTVFGTNPLLLDEFKILVLDETASRIFSRCCGIADLVNAGICMVEDIRNPRVAYTNLEAVYCVSPSVESIQGICDDFPHVSDDEHDNDDEEETKYKAAHVILVGTPPSALVSKLKHSLGTMLGSLQQQIHLDFIADSELSFDLDMETDLQDASLEDIESAPHHQEAMANKLSQVCVQLGITTPVIRWHNAAAPPENERVCHPTIGEVRAARACKQIAELTHKRLLDVHCEDAVDAAKEEKMQEQMDAILDELRAVVVRRDGIIRRHRDAGSTAVDLFELMELDESTVRRKFGIHYAEGSDYEFHFKQDAEKQDTFQVQVIGAAAPPDFCEVLIQDLTTTEEWELQYKKRPLDWGIAGTRDAGVHMYDFRLWRKDAGLAARKGRLAKLDQAAKDLEDKVKQLELTQHRAAEGEYAVADMLENDRIYQLHKAEAAACAYSRPTGRYQPDLTTGVLVVHRLVDLIAPLMHDTTYEAACAGMFDEAALLGMPKDVLLELFHCRQTQRSPKPGKRPKDDGWIDDIDEEAARGMVLDSLRTTADWHRVRHKDLFNSQGHYKLGEEIARDFHASTSAESSTSPVSAEVVARDFSIHGAVLDALHDLCERRNLLTLAKWETEMIRGPAKGGKQERRAGAGDSSVSNRALWEKARDSGEFDVPALRRLLSNKVTDINDKARIVLIFILMRWNKQKTENPSRGDVWKSFVIDEANRQGRFFNHDAHTKGRSSKEDTSTQPSYADQLEHKHEFTSFYTKKRYMEMLMVDGTGLPELGHQRLLANRETVSRAEHIEVESFAEWTERGRVLSCIDLQQLRNRAYVAESGANFDPREPKYVRDTYEERQYIAAVETKWSVFVKKQEKAERIREEKLQDDPDAEVVMPFRWEDGSEFRLTELPKQVETFIDFEGRLEDANTQQRKRQYKDEMKSYLSERQGEAISVAVQNTMKNVLTTTQEGDQWTRMGHEKKAAEYARFKKFELYFEAYYAWLCREELPADTVLGDAWIQKLLLSLQIPLDVVYEVARTLDSPVEREYGYKAKKSRKHPLGAQSKKASQLQPTICGVARDFVEGTLSEEYFPRTKSQAIPKDHSSQKGAKGIVTHSSMPLNRLVVFIIGGVSLWEARMIRKLGDELKCDILIGSNEPARPERVMELFRVAPQLLGVKQAEATGDSSRLKKFPIKKKEVYHLFDQYSQGRGKNRTMSRQAVEQAVMGLSSKLKIKHRSALARALKAAEKTPAGGVNKHEFRILVDNVSQIDDLMREFNVADSDHSYRFSETDFRKAACILTHDFISGSKIKTQDADRAFRNLQIESYVLFDEFIDWMVSERKRRETGRQKNKLVRDPSPAAAERLLSPSRRTGSMSPTRRSPSLDRDVAGSREVGRGHWSTPVPEPEGGARRDHSGRGPAVRWKNPEPEPEPHPEPELGEWRGRTGSGEGARGTEGRSGWADGTRGRDGDYSSYSPVRQSPVIMREPTAAEADAARKTRHKRRQSSSGCCARPKNIH